MAILVGQLIEILKQFDPDREVVIHTLKGENVEVNGYFIQKDPEYLKTIITLVNECRGVEENKVRYQIPTLHGYHLITIGFDVQQFNQKLAIKNMDPIDIQKDNPTLLYYATV